MGEHVGEVSFDLRDDVFQTARTVDRHDPPPELPYLCHDHLAQVLVEPFYAGVQVTFVEPVTLQLRGRQEPQSPAAADHLRRDR